MHQPVFSTKRYTSYSAVRTFPIAGLSRRFLPSKTYGHDLNPPPCRSSPAPLLGQMPRSDNEDPSVPLPSSLLPLGQALGATAAALLLLVPLGTILTLVVRHAPVQVGPDMLHTHSGGDIGSTGGLMLCLGAQSLSHLSRPCDVVRTPRWA